MLVKQSSIFCAIYFSLQPLRIAQTDWLNRLLATIMLSVAFLIVVLSVVMLNVVILSVVAPVYLPVRISLD